MRLDEYITHKKYFSSRTKANRFIREHGVLINGKMVNKPSYNVKTSDIIEINHNGVQKYDKPLGYHKLELIVNNPEFPPIKSSDKCLDIGASAGGFSLFLLEQEVHSVFAIEISQDFEFNLKQLSDKWPNFTYLIQNFFELRKKEYLNYFSLITVDLTLDPEYLVQNLHYFPQFLNSNIKPARILIAIKTGKINNLKQIKKSIEQEVETVFPEFSYNWLNSVDNLKEIFLLIKNL